MSEKIPYGHQSISESDIEAVVRVLRSEWLTQGPIVPEFEKAVAMKCQSHYALAVNSATSALHLACLALEIGPEDTVWTSPNTFVASANCVRHCGANIDFVDIDPETWCLSVERLKEKLEKHKESNLALPKAVILVHLSGQSCDMQAIAHLRDQYNFHLIEDASHAIGGSYQKNPVGNCQFSDIVVFSFHPVKVITTGEGGMALTNVSKFHERMTRLRSHGITRDADQMVRKPKGSWYYEQLDLGFNFRMTDLQAALGVSQLKRLEQFVELRNRKAEYYDKSFNKLDIRRQKIPKGVYSARHLYIIRVADRIHRKIFESLRSLGIGVNLHYSPVHLQPYYKSLGFEKGQFPEAESYSREAISLPIYPDLTDEKQDYVIDSIKKQILIQE